MAYDEDLANRLRELIGVEPAVSEKRMFGGLAFLIGGNLAIAASGRGGILVRTDPAASEGLGAARHVSDFKMRGQPVPGWLRVDGEGVRTTRQLTRWVQIGMSYARSLPAKR